MKIMQKSIADIFRSYAVLDATGRHTNGCDKMSNHNYGDAYEDIINKSFESRDNVNLMMEIGIADGSSLLAWHDIFPNALCVGMDIHHSNKASGDRIEFNFGDQRVQRDCEGAAAGRMFDLIVEDATHHIENTLLTLYWMWPFIRPGGLYIVEEWEGVAGNRERIKSLFPSAWIVGTCGPHIQDEPLVVIRKQW